MAGVLELIAAARAAYDRCDWRDQLSLLEQDWKNESLTERDQGRVGYPVRPPFASVVERDQGYPQSRSVSVVRPRFFFEGGCVSSPIPESEWVWCGYPGHFIAADDCRMHLHTRVGDYRISTVGDYQPRHVFDRETRALREREPGDEADEIGADRKYETYVFRVSGDGAHGEGVVDDFGEIDSEGYNDPVEAERGHMNMCRKYARVAVGLETDGWS